MQEISPVYTRQAWKLGYSEEEEKADTYYDYNLHEPQDASNEDLPDYLTPACMPIDKEATTPEADDWDSEAFDQHTSSEAILPQGDTEVLGKVIKPVNVITAEIQLVKVAQTLLDEIVDYMKMDETMEDENIFQISHSGNKHQCHMTRG